MDAFADIDWAQYDFVDLGCSEGGSLRYCQKRFGARRGLGVDLHPAKIERARTAGIDVILADARYLPREARVRFVSMMDFLEHLPNFQVAEEIIAAASEVASDFLFIRHPSFEGEAYLTELGLRQYWWHWTGHTAHIHVSDYCTIFERLGLLQYTLKYLDPVLDSQHPSILTSDMPVDQGHFSPDEHAPKPFITFAEPAWRAQDIFVALRPFEPVEWASITGNGPRRSSLDGQETSGGENRGLITQKDHISAGVRGDFRVRPPLDTEQAEASGLLAEQRPIGDHSAGLLYPEIVMVPPSREVVSRATPELWIQQDSTASDFFEYMTVSQTYIDPPARVELFPEVYFDSWSSTCLEPSGKVLALNSAKAPEAVENLRHAERIRSRIANGEYDSLDDETPLALLSTPRHPNYYHFLFDDVGRLAFYEAVADFETFRLIVARPTQWQQEVLRLAGVENQLLSLTPGIYRLRNVWIAPRGLTTIVNFRTRAFDRVLRIQDRVDVPRIPEPSRKIYVSRESTRHRRLLNEAEIQRYVRAAGFDVIQPETLSIEDQVRYFNEAQVVMGAFGAGLTNAAFMQRGTCLVEIAPPKTRVTTAHNAIFPTLCGLRELRYGLAVGSDTDFDPTTHDFTIPLTSIERLVSHFLKT